MRTINVNIYVDKQRNNRYYLRWIVKGKRFTEYCRDKDDAVIRQNERFRQLNAAVYGGSNISPINWSRFRDEFLSHKRTSVASSTYPNIVSAIAKFEKLSPVRLSTDLTTQAIQRYVQCRIKNARPSTINSEVGHIQGMVSWGRDLKYLSEPVVVHQLKVPERHNRILTPDELESLKSAAVAESPDMLLQIRLQMATGQNIREVLTLSIDQIDFERNTIRFVRQKTGRRIEIPIKKDLMTDLARWVSELPVGQKWLFFKSNPALKPTQGIARYKRWRRVVKRAGLDGLHTRDIRKTILNILTNYNVGVAQCFSAHADINTLMNHYTDKTPLMRNAAEHLPT